MIIIYHLYKQVFREICRREILWLSDAHTSQAITWKIYKLNHKALEYYRNKSSIYIYIYI